METILYVTAEVVRQVAILAAPVMPQSAKKLLALLGQADDAHTFKALGAAGRLEPGTVLPEPAGVFPRYVEEGAAAPSAPAPKAKEKTAKETATKPQEPKAKSEETKPAKTKDDESEEVMRLIDHHCHLDFPQLAEDRAGLLARAKAAGVAVMVTISTRIKRLPELSPSPRRTTTSTARSARIRTMRTRSSTSPLEEIVRLSQHPKVVAIGEAGLDYYYKHSTPEAQEEGFRRHIAAARADGPAARDPHARGRRRHHPHPRGRARQGAVPGDPALLHRRPGARAARARARALCVVHGRGDVQEVGSAARDRRFRAARSAARGDGCALPRARALPRQDQRARVRGAHGEGARRGEGRLRSRGSRRRRRRTSSGCSRRCRARAASAEGTAAA